MMNRSMVSLSPKVYVTGSLFVNIILDRAIVEHLSLPADPCKHSLERWIFVKPVVVTSISTSKIVGYRLVGDVAQFLGYQC